MNHVLSVLEKILDHGVHTNEYLFQPKKLKQMIDLPHILVMRDCKRLV